MSRVAGHSGRVSIWGWGTPSLERIMALPGGSQPHAIECAESHPQLTVNGTGLRSP